MDRQNELPRTGGHPFYQRLHQVLETHTFDEFVEAQCAPFYADAVGRPSLTPGTYFRLLLIGYFEGIDSERGIAWRTANSLALRGFLGLGLDEVTPRALDDLADTTPDRGVVARIVTSPHDANRQDPHLPMRYDTGWPSSVIRLRIAQPRTTSLPCPAGFRARRPSPMMDL